MIKCSFSFLWICVLFFGLKSNVLDAQMSTKKALLIGISKYNEDTNWATLSSDNDLILLKDALLAQGFRAQDIDLLQNADATKIGIIQSLTSVWYDNLKEGDYALIHFSGHGQQTNDVDGDEIDGLDECIVPYDSPKYFEEGKYEGQNLITDDELRTVLTSIRKKIGVSGQLLVSFDACHSGTATRGTQVARGSSSIMASPTYLNSLNDKIFSKENNHIQAILETQSEGLAPMTAFFGAAQNQLNYETPEINGLHYGSLSYAMAKSLSSALPNESMKTFFERIQANMQMIAPMQRPQIEGRQDIGIFNNELIEQHPYFKILEMYSPQVSLISGGSFQSIQVGTKVGLFENKPNGMDNKVPLIYGLVTKCNPISALVGWEGEVDGALIPTHIVQVTEFSFDNINIKLKVVGHDTILNSIADSLSQLSIVRLTETDPDLILSFQKDAQFGEKVKINDAYGRDIYSVNYMGVSSQQSVIKALKTRILNFVKGRFMRQLDIIGDEIAVEFQIVPSDLNVDVNDIDSLVFLEMDEHGGKKLALRQRFRVLIMNKGIKPAYFSLLDIQPDNVVNILLPTTGATAEEMRILPDQRILIPIEFEIGAPIGKEIFKLIATDEPLDLTTPLSIRGVYQSNPIETLFKLDEDVNGVNMKGNRAKLSKSDINVYTMTFDITE